LEVDAAGDGDNRDHSFSALRAARYLIHDVLPIFHPQQGTGSFVPFQRLQRMPGACRPGSGHQANISAPAGG